MASRFDILFWLLDWWVRRRRKQKVFMIRIFLFCRLDESREITKQITECLRILAECQTMQIRWQMMIHKGIRSYFFGDCAKVKWTEVLPGITKEIICWWILCWFSSPMKWGFFLSKDGSWHIIDDKRSELMQKRVFRTKWFIIRSKAQAFRVTWSVKWQVELLSCLLQEFSWKEMKKSFLKLFKAWTKVRIKKVFKNNAEESETCSQQLPRRSKLNWIPFILSNMLQRQEHFNLHPIMSILWSFFIMTCLATSFKQEGAKSCLWQDLNKLFPSPRCRVDKISTSCCDYIFFKLFDRPFLSFPKKNISKVELKSLHTVNCRKVFRNSSTIRSYVGFKEYFHSRITCETATESRSMTHSTQSWD